MYSRLMWTQYQVYLIPYNLQNDNMLFADSESWCSYIENNNEFFSDFVW